MLKVFLGIVIALVVIFAAWFFCWPLVECAYAWSWEPLFDPMHKFYLFIMGGIIFIPSIWGMKKILIC